MKELNLLKVLSLDSIYGLLEWEERIRIHLYIKRKLITLTPKIEELAQWVEDNNWEYPDVTFKQDRIFYYTDQLTLNDRYLSDYPKNYPEITEAIEQLKLSYNGN